MFYSSLKFTILLFYDQFILLVINCKWDKPQRKYPAVERDFIV